MSDKIDANLVGFAIAEEQSLKTLPASPKWYLREPNSFDEFGGELTTVARRPFSPSRQRKKGSVTDLDADGGYNEDLTQNNFQQQLQGFFFADIREPATNLPLNGTALAVTQISSAGVVTGPAGFGTRFAANQLIKVTGFANGANNGVFPATAVASTTVTLTNGAAVVENPAPAGVKLEVVGTTLAAGDITMAVAPGQCSLNSTVFDFTTLPVLPGQWIFVGGDASLNQFATVAPGYARVSKVEQRKLTFDQSTFTAAADAGAAKEIRIFYGPTLRNEEDPDLIKRRTYQLERTLGKDANGTQAEYLEGAVANELTWNSPLADKVNLDLSFVALDNTQRTGLEGIKSKEVGAVVVKALGEDAFNTSSNVFRLRMGVLDPTTLNPTPLFARVTEWTATVNNNVSAAKSQGTLGGFDTIAGGFDVGGEVTAYFSTVESIRAVRNNADVTFNAIYSKRNAAIILDVPLLSLGGGRLEIEQDAAIMVPLESTAAESPFGHTLLLTWLPYVPNAGSK